jgi:hypothetical protein
MTRRYGWLVISVMVWVVWAIAMISLTFGNRAAIIGVVGILPIAVSTGVLAMLETVVPMLTPDWRGRRYV